MQKLKACFIIIGIIILCSFCVQRVSGLQFGYKLENFFSEENNEFQFYKKYKDQFGSDNNFLMLGIESKNGVFNTSFLEEIDTISERIQENEYIQHIFSPTNIRRKIKVPYLGIRSKPLLDFSSELELHKPNQVDLNSGSIYSNLFSEDSTSIIIYLVLTDTLSKNEKEVLLSTIKEDIALTNTSNSQISSIHFAGQINTKLFYIKVLEKEVLLFALITLILLILFIGITFRSLFAILSSLLILIISVIFTFTLIKIQLGELDFLMTMLPTLLFVIGVSNSIHLLATYKDEFQKNSNKIKAIYFTIKTTGIATLVSSITTAIGFFALYFLPITPIQDFGIYSGIGILITWVISILLIPSLLIVNNRFARHQKREIIWEGFLIKCLNLFLKKKAPLTYTLIAVLILAGVGMTFIKSNSYFLDDLDDNSSLKQDLMFFEQNFGGIRPFELGISLKDSTENLLNIAHMNRLEEINKYLVKSHGVGMLLSANSIFKETNYFLNAGNLEYHRIPTNEKELAELTKSIKKYHLDEKFNFVMDTRMSTTRVTGKMDDIGSAEMMLKNDSLLSFLEPYNKHFDFQLTGAAHLMDKTNANVSFHLLKGLTFSLLLVTLIIALLFKSIKIALFSLIPNFVPLILTAGLIGWLDIDLKISIALIFTVIFGIAVDDTIHFLMHYKRALKEDVENALMNTYKSVGKKLIITSFILTSGFLAFTLSEFNSTFYAGFLITLGLLFALISDLIMLPLLINFIEKSKKRHSKTN